MYRPCCRWWLKVKQRFGLTRVCGVADRGMISANTMGSWKARNWNISWGSGPDSNEVRDLALGCPGRYQKVTDNLRVKELWVKRPHYVVCHNPQEAAKDTADREAMLEALKEKLHQGAKGLVENRGFKRFLKVEKGAVSIDLASAIKAEASFDGKYVLRTNTELPAAEVAVQYKRLLLVEQFLRTTMSVLYTRHIFHQWDATIQGRLLLFSGPGAAGRAQAPPVPAGLASGRADIRRDLLALAEVEVGEGTRWYLLHTALQGVVGKVFRAAGVSIPSPIRPLRNVVPTDNCNLTTTLISHYVALLTVELGFCRWKLVQAKA